MFKLNLFTPDGVVVKDYECEELIVPTIKGEINVLKDHTHVLSTISTGILKVRSGDVWKHFSITHGTLKILGESISILSMTSESSDKIDLKRAENALKNAQDKLKGNNEYSLTDAELEKQLRKKKRAELRVKLGYIRGE